MRVMHANAHSGVWLDTRATSPRRSADLAGRFLAGITARPGPHRTGSGRASRSAGKTKYIQKPMPPKPGSSTGSAGARVTSPPRPHQRAAGPRGARGVARSSWPAGPGPPVVIASYDLIHLDRPCESGVGIERMSLVVRKDSSTHYTVAEPTGGIGVCVCVG